MQPPSDDGLFHFEFAPRPFHQTAAPAYPVVSEPPPVQLGAGETVYRPFSVHHDIAPQLAFAAIYGGFVLVGAVGIARGWPLLWAVDGVVCAVFSVLELDVWRAMLDKDYKYANERYITHERQRENEPAPATQTWTVKAELKSEDGKHTLYDAFDITDAQAWHKFCKAVHFDGKNFSQSQSERDGVPSCDWKAVTDNWKDKGWFVPAIRRGTPELRKSGPAWVQAYATTPPPSEG